MERWEGRTVTHSVRNFGENLQAAHGAVDLTPRMIRDDDTLAAYFVRFEGVCNALYSLDNERTSARDTLPLNSKSRSRSKRLW